MKCGHCLSIGNYCLSDNLLRVSVVFDKLKKKEKTTGFFSFFIMSTNHGFAHGLHSIHLATG